MKKILMTCTGSMHQGKHDIEVSLRDLLHQWPMCCNKRMEPMDGIEWVKIQKALNKADIALKEAHLSVYDLVE